MNNPNLTMGEYYWRILTALAREIGCEPNELENAFSPDEIRQVEVIAHKWAEEGYE